MADQVRCSFRDCDRYCDPLPDSHGPDPALPFCSQHAAAMSGIRAKLKCTESGIDIDATPSRDVVGRVACCAYLLDLDYAISLRDEYRDSLSSAAAATQTEHNLWVRVLRKHRAVVYSAYCSATLGCGPVSTTEYAQAARAKLALWPGRFASGTAMPPLIIIPTSGGRRAKKYSPDVSSMCILCGERSPLCYLKEEKYCEECHAKKSCASGDWTAIEKGMLNGTHCHECCGRLDQNDARFDIHHVGDANRNYHEKCWLAIRRSQKKRDKFATDIRRASGIDT